VRHSPEPSRAGSVDSSTGAVSDVPGPSETMTR
jgi:hypothetical protein